MNEDERAQRRLLCLSSIFISFSIPMKIGLFIRASVFSYSVRPSTIDMTSYYGRDTPIVIRHMFNLEGLGSLCFYDHDSNERLHPNITPLPFFNCTNLHLHPSLLLHHGCTPQILLFQCTTILCIGEKTGTLMG